MIAVMLYRPRNLEARFERHQTMPATLFSWTRCPEGVTIREDVTRDRPFSRALNTLLNKPWSRTWLQSHEGHRPFLRMRLLA